MASSSFLPPTPPLSTDAFLLSPEPSPTTDGAIGAASWTRKPTLARVERKLGDSELSYYLPSRADGVNDMYLYLGFSAPARVVTPERVAAVWTLLRLRHPLLASVVEMHAYDDVRYVRHVPASLADARTEAEHTLEFRTQSAHALIDGYLNGPRTLSNERLSYLIVSEPDAAGPGALTPPATPMLEGAPFAPGDVDEAPHAYELLLCAAHFIGDGMALHNTANDLFKLLASEQHDQLALDALVHAEWEARYAAAAAAEAPAPSLLPTSLEARLPEAKSKLRAAVGRAEFAEDQRRQIGGHAFPRATGGAQPRKTVVPTVAFDEARTKTALKKCKAHGVSISAALFAVCNVAWARAGACNKPELPTMMYSALNLRPYFAPTTSTDSYWFFACGYFNVVLPAFLPATLERTFWHRAARAKEQCARAAKSAFVVDRVRAMTIERGARARMWAAEDDAREAGTYVAPPPPPPKALTPEEVEAKKAKAPSAALVGLSLLGNLDGVYKHAEFPAIKLTALTTGSRQRSGAMLLFGYTFAGKMYVSLGYDENGLERDVVQKFWTGILGAMDEFLFA